MPIYDDLDDRGSYTDRLERCRRDFDATGNPLYAWEAWGVIRLTERSGNHESLPVPEWLAVYLDDCGNQLLGWQSRTGTEILKPETTQPNRREQPGALGRAMGFTTGLAITREQWGGQHDADERLAFKIVNRMWKYGQSLDAAAKDTPGASRDKARRAVERAQRGALRLMQDRLRNESGSAPELDQVAKKYSILCRNRRAN